MRTWKLGLLAGLTPLLSLALASAPAHARASPDVLVSGELFNFQFGLRPYFTPLFGVNDPQRHRGVVLGGMLDGQFRFAPP